MYFSFRFMKKKPKTDSVQRNTRCFIKNKNIKSPYKNSIILHLTTKCHEQHVKISFQGGVYFVILNYGF